MSGVEILKTDLTIKQVNPPQDYWCKSGHVASATFLQKESNKQVSTRFFQVISKKRPAVDGIYCEPCLIIANDMANSKKQIKQEPDGNKKWMRAT